MSVKDIKKGYFNKKLGIVIVVSVLQATHELTGYYGKNH